MKIEFDTDNMSLMDATALVTTMFVYFPNLGESLDAAAFGLKGDQATCAVAPIEVTAAAEAFSPPNDTPPVPPADVAFAQAGTPFVETAGDADGSTETPTSAPAAAPDTAPAPTGVELDANGLPWDARIHAETKAKNKDGSWRGKRNTDPATVAAVTAELRAALAAPRPTGTASVPSAAPTPATSASAVPASAASPAPAASSPPAAPVGAEPVPTPAAPAAAEPQASAPAAPAPVAAPAPSAPAPAAPPAPAPTAPATDAPAPSPAAEFARVMRKVTEAQTAGKITAELTAAAVQSVGLAAMRDFLTRPDLIPSFEATFDAMATA